ncbi:MAG TPA: thioredoxin [Pseudonocardiaceae bacterium]
MTTVQLTRDTFNEVVGQNDFVLIDFWAEWCGPCKMFEPVYERASERHPDLVFARVDTEQEQELAAAFDIRSIPTLMVVRDQVVIYAQPGALPETALEELIGKARELDMEEVHRQIAEHRAQSTE